jgi:hypothetical protein
LRQESGLTIEELSHVMDSALLTVLRAHPIGQALGRTQARLGFVLRRAGRAEEAREAYAEALRQFERFERSGDVERATEVRAEFEKLMSTVSDPLGG